MDFLEKKNSNILERLRQLQVEQCCRHIDKQISIWYKNQNQSQNQVSPVSVVEPLEEVIVVEEIVQDDTIVEQPPPQQQPQSSPQSPTNPKGPIVSNLIAETVEELPQKSPISNVVEETVVDLPKRAPRASSNDSLTTIGCLLSNIKHLESFDSDATESASSNDSYDELEGFSLEEIPPRRPNYPSTHPTLERHPSSDLNKKAIWKWAHERSRLASRWTWLQAQVADLEFRIRGQNDATIHARAHKSHPLPHFMPENYCSRTVPVSRDFRRRRLIKAPQILSDSNKKLVKFSHVPCVCSSLPQTVAPCISCNGRYNYLRQIEGENMSVSDRISLLDPCCHPVLSFPDDLTLGSQLAYLLKQETINRRPTKGRPGRKKGSTAANLAAANGGPNARHPGQKGKYRSDRPVGRPPGSKNPSQSTSNKISKRYRHMRSSGLKRQRSASTTRSRPDSEDDWRPLNHGGLDYSNASYDPDQEPQRPRKERSKSDQSDEPKVLFPDWVMPTTVEIIKYKEIKTPSWRVWENGTCQNENDEDDIEDTSDESYIQRHSKGESEEKKRFSLKPPPGLVKMRPEK